jgi:hypothetical protein
MAMTQVGFVAVSRASRQETSPIAARLHRHIRSHAPEFLPTRPLWVLAHSAAGDLFVFLSRLLLHRLPAEAGYRFHAPDFILP